MEDVVIPTWAAPFMGRRVLLTGHTGFKGSWLATWLRIIGADVTGFALPPASGDRSLFVRANVSDGLQSVIGDVRDLDHLERAASAARPEIIFHLAAQSLVRQSYLSPVETIATNVMGTANVLDVARRLPSVRAVVVISSDKCYENREWEWGYRENEPMGGADPYSASKGCTELVVAAYRRSFFHGPQAALIASARSGNVIGGGDDAPDRLVPDIVRAVLDRRPAILRNPLAIRPWQHVLEPLRGYLMLAERLLEGSEHAAGAWNFGPLPGDALTVRELAGRLVAALGRGSVEERPEADAPHEAHTLRLDITKAMQQLAYRPLLDIAAGISLTAEWYRAVEVRHESARQATEAQIRTYMASLSRTAE